MTDDADHPAVPINWCSVILRQAGMIDSAAGIASGHGEYGLANALWAFEATLRRKAEETRRDQAAALLAGERRPVLSEVHEYRRTGLLTREEFDRFLAEAMGYEYP